MRRKQQDTKVTIKDQPVKVRKQHQTTTIDQEITQSNKKEEKKKEKK
jgi:hypothetical protein